MGYSLYDISNDLFALQELLLDSDGDISDAEVEKTIDQWFSEITNNQNQKVTNYIKLIKSLSALEKARSDEAKALAASAKSINNRVNVLKTRLLWFMQTHELNELITDLGKVSIAKNGGKPALKYPEIWLDDPAAAPEEFHRRTITLDLEALRTALEGGETVEGCEIAPRGIHLRIS